MKNPQSVIGVIFSSDGGSVLLVERRDVPVWVLPGGGLEVGEDPREAIQREILEETGFHVKVDRLVGAYTPINCLAKRTHLYECIILSGQPTPSQETKRVRFFPLSALPKEIPPPFPEWIQDGLSRGEPIQRNLTSVTYWTLFKNLVLHPILVLRFLLARLGFAINTR